MALVGNRILDINSPDIVELSLDSTSKGNQSKFYNKGTHEYIKGAFHYQGKYWKDALVERLAWRLSTMTDTLGVKIMRQDVISFDNGVLGCVSKDFTYYHNIEWLSIYRLLNGQVSSRTGESNKIFRKLVGTTNKLIHIDITDYLIVMIVFDCLLGNEDRHYNNFGVGINTEDNMYCIAPLFDFGLGLFEHDLKYSNLDLDEAILRMQGRPFNENLLQPIKMLCSVPEWKVKVARVMEGIKLPHKGLFPSDIGYEYMDFQIQQIRRLL